MHHRHQQPLIARVVAVAALAASVWSLGPSSEAEAARPASESEAVAHSAQRALDALETWQESKRPAHYVSYVRARDLTAELLAADVGLSGDALALEWSSTGDRQQVAFLSALTQLGVPYRTLAREPGVGFDCSGLTSWAWGEAGVELARSSGRQIREAEDVDDDDAQAGDLVYYPGHVSMYVGQGFMIHSPTHGRNVEVAPLSKRTSAIGNPVADDVSEPSDPSGDTAGPQPAYPF